MGRSYGGGILKLEPGPASHLPIPVVPDAGRYFDEIDRLVRCGRTTEANALADRVVLQESLGLRDVEIKTLRDAASELARHRPGIRNGS